MPYDRTAPPVPTTPRTLPQPALLLALAEAAVLAWLPHGGQRTARRNAWAGMSADASRGRERREADAALEVALARHDARPASRADTAVSTWPHRVGEQRAATR